MKVHLCWKARSPHPHQLLDAGAIALWHEERESELQALVALRPDAISTDTPATSRRIVDKRAAAATKALAAHDRIHQEG